MDIISYNTYKKRYNPQIYYVRDGIKGWAKQTVTPTLDHDGWKQCIYDYEYGMFENEKPKDMAIRLLKETWGEEWLNNKKFVYYPYYYNGMNSMMDALYVFYKEL